MKWDWLSRKKQNDIQQNSQPSASTEGWTLGDSESLAGSGLGAYANQLIEEQYAAQHDGHYLISWDSLYRLLDNDEHATSVALLALPPRSVLVPHLVSDGSPADVDFRIRLDHWLAPAGPLPQSAVLRIGAVVRWQAGEELLPSSAYLLLGAMRELSTEGCHWTPEERLLATGRIQSLARVCRASTDDYLSQTDVVVPERLDIELVSEQAAGVPVIELIPRPEGSPPEWLSTFDAHDRVRARYDVVRPEGGMTHVALPEAMQAVLEHVKDAPGRRYASREADAFLHNPYPFLGDDAEAILRPEQFEAARQRAGIVERELDALPSDDGLEMLLLDTAGVATDVCEPMTDIAAAKALLAAATVARQAALPLFRWRTHRVVFSGTTPSALRQLGEWIAASAATPETLGVDEVFDLQAYSDRVVGFDGKPIHVPFLGKKDASRDWVPDNIQRHVSSTDPATGQNTSTALDEDQLSELEQATNQAERDGSAAVRVPGTTMEIQTDEARRWLSSFSEGIKKQPIAPSIPKNPQPGRATSLRILHNIEALEYGAAVALSPPNDIAATLPAALRPDVQLKQHQQYGVAWLQHRYGQCVQGIRGTLLADDMGLGKTLQCLCLMAWYRECRPSPKPCLVVAPVSLLENWKAEIDKFLDGSQGSTMLLYGQELARHRLPSAQLGDEFTNLGLKKLLRPGFARGATFVLTTYETLRDYELSFGRERWGILVCDEAQKIKTPGALVTRSAKAMQADFKIACTGTPVENSLADLWCLFDFFQPGLLGSLSEFTRVFRKTIELREDGHEAQIERLRKSIEPWVLRRMKSEVAELPPKIDEFHDESDPGVRAIPMSALQRKLYSEAVIGYKRAKEKAEEEEVQAGTLTLALLHRLRMICSNPLAAAQEGAELLSITENVLHSPKLRWLLDQLEQIKRRGEKVIVFTEYRDIQRLVQRAIGERFGVGVSIVNGSTTVDSLNDMSRQKIIDRFQAQPGFGAIVLSTTAVGFGVNIQKANHVIHFTRPWNPAKEDQATDRAYRIGQEKPVWVYCPTIAGDGYESFEQRLAERLSRKRALSQDLLAPESTVSWSDFEDLIA
ncbi:helicase [Rhodanobacter fulvus Jip2]|uniref:Helicase n=1 Tax=Rhodanobacter fulvus Jip2 TaxID=1163408 RepID=I4VQ52_9GAMM|nr:DEAD/DEAH box helicase [Rhodanobacter fulvus]EIL89343.1 helicase [Rhodanobacter fulvus Jip2]